MGPPSQRAHINEFFHNSRREESTKSNNFRQVSRYKRLDSKSEKSVNSTIAARVMVIDDRSSRYYYLYIEHREVKIWREVWNLGSNPVIALCPS